MNLVYLKLKKSIRKEFAKQINKEFNNLTKFQTNFNIYFFKPASQLKLPYRFLAKIVLKNLVQKLKLKYLYLVCLSENIIIWLDQAFRYIRNLYISCLIQWFSTSFQSREKN